MIGVDTNVLARYFAADTDHPEQTRLARSLIDESLSRGEPIFVSKVTLCETVWVLRRAFKLPKVAVLQALDWIQNHSLCVVESAFAISQAIEAYRDSNADLADFLIASAGTSAGCSTTYTFDIRASQEMGFELLQGDPA